MLVNTTTFLTLDALGNLFKGLQKLVSVDAEMVFTILKVITRTFCLNEVLIMK